MSGSVGSSQGQKFQLFKMVLVTPGTYWAEKSNYCGFSKTTENDLHTFRKGAVLQSELLSKSNRMNTAPILHFLSRGVAEDCCALILSLLFIRVHAKLSRWRHLLLLQHHKSSPPWICSSRTSYSHAPIMSWFLPFFKSNLPCFGAWIGTSPRFMVTVILLSFQVRL